MFRLPAGILAFMLLTTIGWPQQPHSYTPPKGFVPDSITAVRIAVAVWGPIYGDSAIQHEAPFRAVLRRGVWTVTGTLSTGVPGGVAIVEIAKANAAIIRVSHGR